MGIQGLLPLLKSIMVPIHIKELEGCSVAVDTYSWLHKGALSCSRELCKGLPTTRHIEYCMHRVNLLRHYGVKPILVFDGGLLPMKIEQENKRARVRKENLARAIEHESCGNSAAAYECYQKAVDISPSIAHELIQVLKQESIWYVVAPYEADAQMTFLAVSKQVDAIITEDSDLIPFGCPRVIYKMDKFGQGVEFKHSMIPQNKELCFSGFTKQMLLEMCILSGCDYLQSLSGMGLKRAHALIKKFKSYDKVIKHLRYSSASVPPHYEESFKKAILTFQHQRVYDPITENIVHLSDVSDNVGDDLDFLGPPIPQHIAQGIAKGDLDPFSHMLFEVGNVSSQLLLSRNSHLKDIKHESERKKLDLPVQKNLLTKYFCFASLEAKRNFRVPRVSPKDSSPVANSPFSPQRHVNMETSCCEINSSLPSSPDSAIVTKTSPNNSVEHSLTLKVRNCSGSPSHDKIDEARSPTYSEPQQSGNSVHKLNPRSHNKHDLKNVPVAIESKTRMENRKVTVRSCYFQHKQVNENNLKNKQETFYSKDDMAMPENGIANGSSHSYFKGTAMKRKTSQIECIETENVKPKHVHLDASLNANGYSNSNLEETFMETKDREEKFGSNISHLGRYSDIAEKSMERFVSVISSFRCTPSGSRASGLRAPLRDVRNTCNNRSSDAVDLSQFAYIPKDRKSTSASHRF